jgi:PBP1b-binding outer membrane lipoprotein LpoB
MIMKKIVLPFMMAVALFLFVSCGSKGYKQYSKAIKETTKELNRAKDCDDIRKAWDNFDEELEKMIDDGSVLDITDKEEKKLKEQEKELEDLFEDKVKELCKDVDDWD